VLKQSFTRTFGERVSVNAPFQGGYITRTHAAELPWVQLELSRGAFRSSQEKREAVLEALHAFCRTTF
jgi:N-formylglutamate amidohydrolase